MRIAIATPLYPPEIAEPAPYAKELAKRLGERHEVTLIAYARLPEKVPKVRIVVVDKHRPLPLRLLSFFFSLVRVAHNVDVMYALNGSSVELPLALASLVVSRPLIIHIGDPAAHERAQKNRLLRTIERFAFSRAHRVLSDMPDTRPEIIPFEPFPKEKFAAYESSWDAHIRMLEDLFNHAIT